MVSQNFLPLDDTTRSLCKGAAPTPVYSVNISKKVDPIASEISVSWPKISKTVQETWMKLCSCHQHDLRELLPYSILMEITWFQRKFWLFFCHSGARISSHFSFLKRGMQFTIYIVALCTSWTASLPSCGRGEIVAMENERKDRPLCSLYTPPLCYVQCSSFKVRSHFWGIEGKSADYPGVRMVKG